MPEKRTIKPTFEPEATPHYLHLTVEQARTMRAEHAMWATVYADRYTQARAAARYSAALRWAGEYRRRAATCRRLGERIRGEAPGPLIAVAERGQSVVPLARRHMPDVAPTGEAA
jgi:hypothetical protein